MIMISKSGILIATMALYKNTKIYGFFNILLCIMRKKFELPVLVGRCVKF